MGIEMKGGSEAAFEELERAKTRVFALRCSDGERSDVYIEALMEFRDLVRAWFDRNDSVVGAERAEEVDEPVVEEKIVELEENLDISEVDLEIEYIPIPKVFYKDLFFELNGRVVFCESSLALGEPLCFTDEAGLSFFSNGVVTEISDLGENLNVSFLVKISCGCEFVLPIDRSLGGTAGDYSV